MGAQAGSVELRGVVFDKDGTLLDFERTWGPVSRRCAAAVAPDRVDELLRASGHDPRTDAFVPGSAIVAGTARDVAAAYLSVLGSGDLDALTSAVDATFAREAAECAVAIDGVAEAVAALCEAGMVLGVATSDNTDSAERGLRAIGLRERFAVVCGYDAGHGGKPGPGMVLAFCRAVGLQPQEVAVVGDSVHDLEMGRAAGAGLVVGVLTGPATQADLGLADVVLDSVADLPGWISRRG